METVTTTARDKEAQFLQFLKEGWVTVYLDPRRDGVRVPEDLKGQPCLALQYGYNMPVPIPDLTITDDGVWATLSFQQHPHDTFVPWEAVFSMRVPVTDSYAVFEDSIPKEVKVYVPQGERTRKNRPHLRLVD